MIVNCPNRNLNEWKELEDYFGENVAESLFHRNEGDIPSIEEGKALLKASKIAQFKRAVRYLDTTTSAQVSDMLPQMFRIVQPIGDDLYVVKGSTLAEKPAPGTEQEIHQANVKFLNSINKEFGPIFNLQRVEETAKTDSLKSEIVNDIKNSDLEGMYGLTLKNTITDEATQDQAMQELIDQVRGGEATRRELEKNIPTAIVDKVFRLSELFNRPNEVEAGKKLFNEPNAETSEIEKQYKQEKGINTPEGSKIYKLNTTFSKRIADAFEAMQHNPQDPETKEAYQAMAKETVDQYKAISDAGYKIEIYEGKGEPYKNSGEMIKDIRDNKHQYILSTEKEFGTNPITDDQRIDNPLLRNSGQKDVNGKPLLVNDIFRGVHDFFGHSERGNAFGPIGEENAWDVHARMYSDLARRAMTTETRGQNSWVNFGEHMREQTTSKNTLSLEEINKIPKGETFHSIDKLKESILKEGIKEPIVLRYYVQDNALRVQEGHHRIKAANELGLKDIPTEVSVVWGKSISEGNEDIVGKKIYHPPVPLDVEKYSKRNYAPSNVSLEELGYKSFSEGRLLKKGEPGYLEIPKRPFAEQKIGLLPEEFSALRDDSVNEDPQALKIAPGTYKVSVNQDALNDLAVKNAEASKKGLIDDQKEAVNTNNDVLYNRPAQYSKAYDDTVVTSVNHNVLNNLQNKFNIPFEVVNDGTVNWRGKFENGKVIVNAAHMNEFTALHEYLHPFTMAMQKDNAELYNNLINELQTSEEGKKVIEEVKKNYPELSQKDQIDEALVTHLSKLANQGELKSKPWYQAFIDWFKNFFGKNGISISDLSMNMTMADLADKIIDPTYTADLQHYQDSNENAVRYDKENKPQEYSERLTQLINNVKGKLALDVKIAPKNKDEADRKFYSGKQLKDLENNEDAYKAIAGYVNSSIINAKKIGERFDEFKKFYEAKGKNASKEDILRGMSILDEMEGHNALYNESRFIVDAIREENPDEYDDTFKVLRGRLDGDAQIVNDYYDYGLKLQSDLLYPHMKKGIENTIKAGNIEKMPGYNEYLNIKKENPNITDNDAIEQGVKKWLRGQMRYATIDMGFFNSHFSGMLNSKDGVGQAFALALKEQFSKDNDKLFKIKNNIQDVVNKTLGKKLITTNKGHKEAYGEFLHQVDNWERTGFDEKDNPVFGYVKRTAFIEPYRHDEFYKAKKAMFKDIGIRPNKNDESAYKAWEAKKEAWFNEHTVRTYNDKGEVTNTTPAQKYVNPEYARVANNPLYKEIYKHYQDANGKLGQYQLKFGIIPQQEVEGGLKGLKASKGVKGNLEEIGKNLNESVGANVGEYYAQDIDGKEYKNVPIRLTKMIDEDRLSYNLAKSVSDYWESSNKYEKAKEIEPAARVMKNFVNGNSYLKLDPRQVPAIDAKGVKKMGAFAKNMTKTKDQANINRMFTDFVNDTIYGESEKKVGIKSPFLNLKYEIYKKGDTSANGKPHREYIYSLEDLKKKTGSETIENGHFTRGVEKDVNGYGVKLLTNDKILSVNKTSRKLNHLSSTITLGVNAVAGTAHLLRASASAFIEASGGKYFNLAELGKGYKKYMQSFLNFDFIEDLKGGKGSLISQHLTHYGTFNGEFLNEYGQHVGQGVANKLMRRSSLFFMIHGAEHLTQTSQMLAAMEHVKVDDGKGGKIALADAFEKDKDGYRKLKDGVKWTEQQDNDFKNTLQSLNKDRGNFSEFDKAGIQRLWYGKMLIMFRRHIYNGVQRRFGSSYIDYERGGAVQGYYRSFMTSLVSELNEYRLNRQFRKLTPDENYAAKKTLADIGVFGMGMAFLAPALKNIDKDKKDGWNDYAALFARRLQMDQSFFYNPLEWKKIVQEPVVTGSTIGKLYNFLSQAAVSPSEEYQKDGPGYQAGDSKLGVKAKKLLPGYSTLLNLHDPTDLMKFYGIDKKEDTK